MRTLKRNIITLHEHQPQLLPYDALPTAAVEKLWRDYPHYVEVEFPSPRTAQCWRLTAQEWVGFLPLTPTVALALHPKVALPHLLRMMEVAYGLENVAWGSGLYQVQSLPAFFEGLALLLARRVLERCRRGLHQAYEERGERLPYLRGQLELAPLLRTPWQTAAPCRYQEQTADVEDNQILAWTLHRLSQSGLCSETAAGTVARAQRTLQHHITLHPFNAAACRHRLYSRLNADYAPLHALCAFFLEQSVPEHQPGIEAMLPFVINMPRLYERFVAAWLKANLPSRYRLQVQERHPLSPGELYFEIDLVLYDTQSGPQNSAVCCVMDTKYKTADKALAAADIAQVVAYAAAKGAPEAILIYPSGELTGVETYVGKICVRALSFPVQLDLNAAGQLFLTRLFR